MSDDRSVVEEMIRGANTTEVRAAVVPMGPRRSMAAGEPAPGEIPTTIDDLPVQVTRTYELSVTAAASADIPVAGGVSGGLNRRVVVLERAAYKPITSGGTKHHYGYALRLAITVSKRTANMKLTLPFLAASAEVGEIEAKWILQVIGLAGPKIDEVTLPPTELNVETFVLAKQSLEKLIGAVRDPGTRFAAQPIAVERPEGTVEMNFAEAVGRAYALSRIEKGRSIHRALDELDTPTDEMRTIVTDAYQDFAGITDPEQAPGDEARRQARSLLSDVKVDPR